MKYYGLKEKSFSRPETRFALAIFLAFFVLSLGLLFSKSSLGLIDCYLSSNLNIDFVNVGQGDCCIVRTPKGRVFIIDAGTNVSYKESKQQNRELIQDYLKKLNVKKIDGIVVTHWHTDNFSGFIPVLNNYQVGVIYETPIGIKNEIYKDFENICIKKNIKRISVKSGMQLMWGDELFVQALNPDDTFSSNIHSEMNNDSIVLVIRYGKVQLLLCGDIQEDAVREVIKYGDGLKSQIIKVPNHGADTKSNTTFYKFIKPKDAIISVGKDNPFKFPSDKTLDVLKDMNINVYRTDINGTINLSVGGKNNTDYIISVDRKL